MSKLLINEMPLQVLPGLAMKIGLNEALFAQQLHYWLTNQKMGKLIDGQRWIKNSTKQWRADNFPFWSEKTIQRIIESLRKQSVVLTRKDLNDSPYDHTVWFTINYAFLEEKEERYRQTVYIATDDLSTSDVDKVSISSIIPESTTETTVKPETTNTETNQPDSRSLIGANGLVGSALPNQQQVEQLSPATTTAIQATADAPPLPEHPPAPPGPTSPLVDFLVAEIDAAPPADRGKTYDTITVAEYDRSVALLTDDDVGMSKANAARFAERYSFPWLVAHVADWWEDWQTGAVNGVGALYNRIRAEWSIVGVSDVFLRSDLYRRHYPLPPDRLAEWAAWRSSAAQLDALLQKGYDEDFALGLVGAHEPPAWLDELPPDVRALLDALPVPTGEAVQP